MINAGVDRNIVFLGASGQAKVIIDIIEREGRYRIVGIIDPSRQIGDELSGYRVLGSDDELAILAQTYSLFGCIVAIGDNWRRHLVVEKVMALAPTLQFVSAIHPAAQIARGATIGRGAALMAGSVVNSDCKIGNFCLINTNASVDHDSVMEDFSSLAPGVTIGGNVRLGAFSAVSLGASVIHNRNIGRQTVIGAGAVVVEDIPDYSVAYGTPARIIRSRTEGERYL